MTENMENGKQNKIGLKEKKGSAVGSENAKLSKASRDRGTQASLGFQLEMASSTKMFHSTKDTLINTELLSSELSN